MKKLKEVHNLFTQLFYQYDYIVGRIGNITKNKCGVSIFSIRLFNKDYIVKKNHFDGFDLINNKDEVVCFDNLVINRENDTIYLIKNYVKLFSVNSKGISY